MTEVRPIRTEEAASFLQILVDSFGLDLARARQAFYADPLFDINRKWALFDAGEMQSILTVTSLTFGWGKAIGIAGVATRESARGQGYGRLLLESTLKGAVARNEGPALLFAHRPELYERVGFHVLDNVITADIAIDGAALHGESLSGSRVRERYDTWATGSPHRLRRDDARWRYWNWFHRPCEAWGEGYLCVEHQLCREAVSTPRADAWPLGKGAKWVGLAHLAEKVGVPITHRTEDMFLMGRGYPGLPEMFLTDQF